MRNPSARLLSIVTMALAMLVVDLSATCGGGGGGGTGGMGSKSMGEDIVYQVPWKNIRLEDPLPSGGLVVYWFPASQNELEKSSLRNSRTLSVYATQCVTLGVSASDTPLGQKLLVDEKLPVAVLADTNGKIIAKAAGKDGMLRVGEVEKMLDVEVKTRQNAVKDAVKGAKDSAKRGDKDDAIAKYRSVLDQRCLFPREARDAAGELKKLGVAATGDSSFPMPPSLDSAVGARIERTMQAGLMAENMEQYPEAERLYVEAARIDPADPVPLRYLGELYRHQTGDWTKAREVFDAILKMPADPLSRAVAMHGLGKMTIHDGDFKRGLSLMEESAKEFPLALTYRNLAVYWHSEGDLARADEYTKRALALDPTDPFNVVFAAAFMAGSGHGDEALKIARENEGLLCASYNLAAIYAQIGQKDRALALLRRHFFEYERYQSVRSKEMMEARVDAVFDSIATDPEFVAMTADADGHLPMPRR